MAALTAALCLRTAAALAHGTHQERLRETSERIAKRSRDPLDFLERAEVHRQEGHLAEARADLARAEALAPNLPAVTLLRARLHLDAGEATAARMVLDRLLARRPRLGEARALRAEALEAEGRIAEAADELEPALEDLTRATPEHYLHAAALMGAADSVHAARALRLLARGIERLGPAPGLVERAIDLELALGRPQATLAWHELLRPFHEKDPTWIARRGELLEAAGQPLEALAAYTTALEAIEALPAGRRAAPATQEFEAAMRARLKHPTTGRKEQR